MYKSKRTNDPVFKWQYLLRKVTDGKKKLVQILGRYLIKTLYRDHLHTF